MGRNRNNTPSVVEVPHPAHGETWGGVTTPLPPAAVPPAPPATPGRAVAGAVRWTPLGKLAIAAASLLLAALLAAATALWSAADRLAAKAERADVTAIGSRLEQKADRSTVEAVTERVHQVELRVQGVIADVEQDLAVIRAELGAPISEEELLERRRRRRGGDR